MTCITSHKRNAINAETKKTGIWLSYANQITNNINKNYYLLAISISMIHPHPTFIAFSIRRSSAALALP